MEHPFLILAGVAAAATIAVALGNYPTEGDIRKRVADGEGLDHDADLELIGRHVYRH
jgi:hypothetical protein